MTRKYHTFKVKDCNLIKQQILTWASQFSICCFLDNQKYKAAYHSYEGIFGVGSIKHFHPSGDFFPSLDAFISENEDWIFCHFNYEMRDIIERRISAPRTYQSAFSDCFLFVPEVVILINQDELIIGVINQDANSIYFEILDQIIKNEVNPSVQFQPKITKHQYVTDVNLLQKHIMLGDCYEINFCQQFLATAPIHPVSVYHELIFNSPNPFSAFYRVENNYLLCASPEIYLKKTGDKIISQPIKGTAARHKLDLIKDEENKRLLETNTKERSENVMIVDLVRNDLSRICEQGSVKVEELCTVYSYPHVHQMISTVAGDVKQETSFADILQATFPMGSMTGAPKKKVMELIETFEQGNRGIYSGTIGYFTPEKDFDFNVVIRSIVYNMVNDGLSFHLGSAITANSDPENEYAECLLKGKAILDIFSKTRVE